MDAKSWTARGYLHADAHQPAIRASSCLRAVLPEIIGPQGWIMVPDNILFDAFAEVTRFKDSGLKDRRRCLPGETRRTRA